MGLDQSGFSKCQRKGSLWLVEEGLALAGGTAPWVGGTVLRNGHALHALNAAAAAPRCNGEPRLEGQPTALLRGIDATCTQRPRGPPVASCIFC